MFGRFIREADKNSSSSIKPIRRIILTSRSNNDGTSAVWWEVPKDLYY